MRSKQRQRHAGKRKAVARLLAAVDKTITAVDEIRSAKAELERLAKEAAP